MSSADQATNRRSGGPAQQDGTTPAELYRAKVLRALEKVHEKLEQLCTAIQQNRAFGQGWYAEDFHQIACLIGSFAQDERLLIALAKHSRVPPEVLAHLANNETEEVRIAVAGNQRTPSEVLRALAEQSFAEVAVAGNPNTPGDVLSRLAEHWDMDVRRKVAHNPGTPDEVRRALVGP